MENDEVMDLANAAVVETLRTKLRKVFALRDCDVASITRKDEERGSENNPKYVVVYRMQITHGAVVDLGTAGELLNFRKVQAAFAESFGHVIPSKEAKNWDDVAQAIFDLWKALGARTDSITRREDVEDEEDVNEVLPDEDEAPQPEPPLDLPEDEPSEETLKFPEPPRGLPEP